MLLVALLLLTLLLIASDVVVVVVVAGGGVDGVGPSVDAKLCICDAFACLLQSAVNVCQIR